MRAARVSRDAIHKKGFIRVSTCSLFLLFAAARRPGGSVVFVVTTTKKTTTLQRSRLPSRQRRQQRVRPHRGRRLRGLLGQHHVPKLMFAAEFGAMCLPQCQELHQKCLFSHVSNRRERQIFAGNFEKCGVAMKHSCKLKQICCRDFVFANSFANHCWHTHALECTKHKFAETNKNGEKSKFSTSDFARV